MQSHDLLQSPKFTQYPCASDSQFPPGIRSTTPLLLEMHMTAMIISFLSRVRNSEFSHVQPCLYQHPYKYLARKILLGARQLKVRNCLFSLKLLLHILEDVSLHFIIFQVLPSLSPTFF